MPPTNRLKYKYFHSTVQRAKDRRQKFPVFCRLTYDHITSNLISLISMTLRQTANGKNETFPVCVQQSVFVE